MAPESERGGDRQAAEVVHGLPGPPLCDRDPRISCQFIAELLTPPPGACGTHWFDGCGH